MLRHPLEWEPHDPHSADITLAHRPLARYTWSPDYRQPFFHPVFTPRAPSPVTVFAPNDHPWHRGLWWAWKYANDVNFWDEQDDHGRGFGTSRVVSHEVFKLADGSFTVSQRLELRHMVTDELVAEEKRRLTIRPQVPGTNPEFSGWTLDWDSTWTAPHELTFSTTLVSYRPWGGYGGLNYRPSRGMALGEEIGNSEGLRGKPDVHGKPTRWGYFVGGLDGDPRLKPTEPLLAGAAFLLHPGNPEGLNSLYFHSFKEGGIFGVMKTGPLIPGPLTIPASESLRLRTRIIWFDFYGPTPVEELEAAYGRYAG